MNFLERTQNSIKFWTIDSWEETGFVHGFVGADLNIKNSKDQAEKFLAALVKKEEIDLFLFKQIHSDIIIEASIDNLEQIRRETFEADAWLVDRKALNNQSLFFGIKTADCYPVILYCPVSKFAANLHCGWRGAVGGLLIKAVKELQKRGVSISNLEVAIGPGAGGCCYQVTEDFFPNINNLSYLSSEEKKEVLNSKGLNTCCDIEKLLLIQLNSLGIKNVKSASLCTICNNNFFSFRREKQNSGRQLSFIS